MKKSALSIILFMLIGLTSKSQELSPSQIIGKWGICHSLDTINKDCSTPFNFYIFNADGTCQHGEVIIMNKKIPVMGKWKIVDDDVKIEYDFHPNFSFPPQTFPNIRFLTDKLFYYKVTSSIEAPGSWHFFTLKKL